MTNLSEGMHYDILVKLCVLPRTINSLNGSHESWQHLAEYIVHELCSNKCFGLKRAAYLLDNPDFDIVKGVAGYACSNYEHCSEDQEKFEETFKKHADSCDFNRTVKDHYGQSLAKYNVSDKEIIERFGKLFGMQDPRLIVWDSKHDNKGVLVYEADKGTVDPKNESAIKEWLEKGLHLLNFCHA